MKTRITPLKQRLGLPLAAMALCAAFLSSCGGGSSDNSGTQGSNAIAAPDSASAAMVNRAIAEEATRQLTYFCSLQDSYFNNNHKYAASPLELQGFTEDDLHTSGSSVNFEIKLISTTEDNFVFNAIAEDMDGDGTQAVWEVDKSCKPHEVKAD